MTLQEFLHIEQVVWPIVLALVGVVLWMGRVEWLTRANKDRLDELQREIGEKCEFFRDHMETKLVALHARDDTAKARDEKIDETMGKLSESVHELSVAVAVLGSKVESLKNARRS